MCEEHDIRSQSLESDHYRIVEIISKARKIIKRNISVLHIETNTS